METEKFEIHINNKHVKVDLPEDIKAKIKSFVNENVEKMKKVALEKYNEFANKTKTKPDELETDIIYTLTQASVKVYVEAKSVSQYYGTETVYYDWDWIPYCDKMYEPEKNKTGLELKQFYNTITAIANELVKT